MCPGCKRLWTVLTVLWSTFYVICGALQLMIGIFFLISVHELHLYSIIAAGICNIIIGIGGGMLACICILSPNRQEALLYVAISLLLLNTVNVVVVEWILYITDMPKILNRYPNQLLISVACFITRIANATVLFVSFIDSQFAFCSMQVLMRSAKHTTVVLRQKVRGSSNENVADIEYIIPRTKSSTKDKQHHTVYDAYAQSWVFEADNTSGGGGGGGPSSRPSDSPYLQILQNGKSSPTGNHRNPMGKASRYQQNGINTKGHIKTTPNAVIEKPILQVEEASDDSTSHSDRKLGHMKSFSRSTSPAPVSASSSQISLNNYPNANVSTNAVPIYDYLEKLTEPKIYRSRLNTALSIGKGESSNQQQPEVHYQVPQVVSVGVRQVESCHHPVVEKVQYASLMKELQKAISSKKEPPSSSSSSSHHKTPPSNGGSEQDSGRSEAKNSDAEFSKELEAALQLIQDLESPNTVETPSDAVKSPHQDVTMNVENRTELLSTFKPANGGKSMINSSHSQSTSGYSSPTHHRHSHSHSHSTSDWSTTSSSINGSNNKSITNTNSTDAIMLCSNNSNSDKNHVVDNSNRSITYSIHRAQSATVISLYAKADGTEDNHRKDSNLNDNTSKSKSVTLVQIGGNPTSNHSDSFITTDSCSFLTRPGDISSSTLIEPIPMKLPDVSNTITKCVVNTNKSQNVISWNVMSLLRKKKRNYVPKLCPELEDAIFKSESLAYLSDLELLAKHKRNSEIQREIEERVIQQLGVPRTESNC